MALKLFSHDTGGWRQTHIFRDNLKGLNEILMRGEKYCFTLITRLQLYSNNGGGGGGHFCVYQQEHNTRRENTQ